MAITGVNGGVSSNYANYYASKSKDDTRTKSESTGEVSSKSVDTAKTGTTTATGSKSRTATEYTKYLQEKFSYFNKSTSMEGVPTTVSVSSAFIKKCANDPEKAKFLEENLNALPECAAKAVAGCQGTLTNLSYQVDANGNISVAISGTSDPDGKIAKENAERKAKESKEKEKKLEERRAAKKAEEKKLEERLAAKKALTEKTDTNINTSSGQIRITEASAYTSQTINVGSNFNSYS